MQAEENWLENERNHIQGRRNYLNMILQRSRDFMSSTKVKGPWVRTYTQKNAKILRKYIQEDKNRLRISVVAKSVAGRAV